MNSRNLPTYTTRMMVMNVARLQSNKKRVMLFFELAYSTHRPMHHNSPTDFGAVAYLLTNSGSV